MNDDRLDPYAVLGLTRDAGPAQITHAYRALLRRHHPDARPLRAAGADGPDESDMTLARVIAAYSQLREAESRAAEPPDDGGDRPSPHPRVDADAGGAWPFRAGPVRWLRAAPPDGPAPARLRRFGVSRWSSTG